MYGESTRQTGGLVNRASPQELVAALKRDNLLWRRHAQRLLVERGQTDVVPALVKLVGILSVDEIGLNVGAIHALWTLHGLGAIDERHPEVLEAARAALAHPSAGVRRNALQVLPATPASAEAIVASGLTKDEDAQVKLAAILALADMPSSGAAGKQVAQLSVDTARSHERPLAGRRGDERGGSADVRLFARAQGAGHQCRCLAGRCARMGRRHARGRAHRPWTSGRGDD